MPPPQRIVFEQITALSWHKGILCDIHETNFGDSRVLTRFVFTEAIRAERCCQPVCISRTLNIMTRITSIGAGNMLCRYSRLLGQVGDKKMPRANHLSPTSGPAALSHYSRSCHPFVYSAITILSYPPGVCLLISALTHHHISLKNSTLQPAELATRI